MIFWRKIVIFLTKYPKNFSASLRLAHFFLSAPPLTWNPGSAPAFDPTGARNHDLFHWFSYIGRFMYLLVIFITLHTNTRLSFLPTFGIFFFVLCI
jgi:hypothetical protein